MNDVLTTTLIVACLVLAAWAFVLVIIGRPVLLGSYDGLALTGGIALLELGLVAQAVIGFVALPSAPSAVDRLEFGSYLVGVLIVLPIVAWWGLFERSRWGPAVFVVGCLAVPVMVVRLQQIWTDHV